MIIVEIAKADMIGPASGSGSAVARPPRSTSNSSVAHSCSRSPSTHGHRLPDAPAQQPNEAISRCQTHSLHEGMMSETSCFVWRGARPLEEEELCV